MTDNNNQLANTGAAAPRRILAGLGAVADEIQTIEAALVLAEALRTEITGYFVEESNLLDLAGLPFAKAIPPSGRSARPIEPFEMEREFVQAAATWRRTLSAHASRSRITCTFRTARGSYCAEIAKAAVETDIVVVNPANISQYGRTAVAAVLNAMGPAAGMVLLPRQGWIARRGPVAIVVEDIPGANLFRMAERIASAAGVGTVILILPGGERKLDDMRKAAHAALGPDAQLEMLPGPEPSDAVMSIADWHPSYVIWSGGNGPQREEKLDLLLRAAGAPVVLLRDIG